MSSRGKDKSIQAVQKVLGEPVFCELSERAWRTRTTLLAVAVASTCLVLFGLQVNPEATLFGFKVTGLTDELIRRAIVAVLVYLTFHFVWTAWDSFCEWRLRVTGTRVAFVTTGVFASEDADYPSDPRQSTLANWWLGQASKIGNLVEPLNRLRTLIEAQQAEIKAACATGEPLNVAAATAPFHRALEALNECRRSQDDAVKALSSLRIPASLDRFERWHELFLRSQNLRWLVLDILLPILVAAFAIFLILQKGI